MVPVTSLVLPILISAVLVFLASFLLHMLLPWHRHDLNLLANEGEVQDALRRLNIAPGDYAVPCARTPADMKSPQFIERMQKGPVAFMTILPGGKHGMGKPLTQWFLYSVLVGIFAAYVTGRAVGAGESYLQVFRFAGTTAFLGYSFALMQNSIWWQKNWGATLRSMIDGLVYGLLTAGTFGWLWPR
jgi:hypothetical protein